MFLVFHQNERHRKTTKSMKTATTTTPKRTTPENSRKSGTMGMPTMTVKTPFPSPCKTILLVCILQSLIWTCESSQWTAPLPLSPITQAKTCRGNILSWTRGIPRGGGAASSKPQRWKASPFGIHQDGPKVEDLPKPDRTKTKETIDSFLTRDSRNTFIGKIRNKVS